jgi:inorganic pyrophosphatase
MEIDKLIEGADIMRFIKVQRIKWLGHIQRTDQARQTWKLLAWKPVTTRPIGRPRQRWQKGVMEDLKKLKVKNWKEAATDRRTWRDLAEKAKTHKGL